MQGEQKYWWIRLGINFFDQPKIDYLREQKNGSDYILLYQKLCLMSANTGGALIRHIGELMIPYDPRKISEITKFPIDTVMVAMTLFQKIGLIYRADDGVIHVPDVPEMVGYSSASSSADRVRKWRARKRAETLGPGAIKQIEKAKPKRAIFKKPTVEEVAEYIHERGGDGIVDPGTFVDFYEASGWTRGRSRTPIKDWKACVRTWITRGKREGENHNGLNPTEEAAAMFEEMNQRQ